MDNISTNDHDHDHDDYDYDYDYNYNYDNYDQNTKLKIDRFCASAHACCRLDACIDAN
jgi:hypothetical protein